jgi:hypothetical protein
MPEGITSQDDLTDDSILTCANCGTVITVNPGVTGRSAMAAMETFSLHRSVKFQLPTNLRVFMEQRSRSTPSLLDVVGIDKP